jgi:hypothetical protein
MGKWRLGKIRRCGRQMTPLERRSELERKRQEILNNTTQKQRVKEMEQFVEELKRFGENNFPNAHKRWDEEG